MPELALARSDHDYTVSSRADSATSRRLGRAVAAERAAPAARKAPARAGRFVLLKYMTGSNLARAALAAVTLGFLVNALALQKARHPAPLFVSNAPVVVTPASNPALVAPAVPAPRPPDLATVTPAATPRMTGSARPAASHPVAVANDPIALLLRPHVGQPKPEPAKAEPIKSVMAAQKALLKLGFVLKPDGVLGGTTRQAIERFERDQGMPVKGDLTPKIMRILTAQSGVVID